MIEGHLTAFILVMFNAARNSIRVLLQDLGSVNTVAGKRIVYKSWSKEYFSKAFFERGVDIEIVLSNPNSGEAGEIS